MIRMHVKIDPLPGVPTDLLFDAAAERYEKTTIEIGKQLGGILVTDKKLHAYLKAVFDKIVRGHGGPPDVLRPPHYPAEEFEPFQAVFTIAIPVAGKALEATKTYFVRRPRMFPGLIRQLKH
jgi:hypothetical protein